MQRAKTILVGVHRLEAREIRQVQGIQIVVVHPELAESSQWARRCERGQIVVICRGSAWRCRGNTE
jgi:NADPH-dependent ferric siderophore reductase